jgi:uncharacterized membrane protein YbaN (DUF454 family)
MVHLYLVLGLAFVILAFAGVFLPVLPTTPFLILAAACFTRSSPRLENWLLTHPNFGPALRAWRERGAVSWKAKLMALAGVSLGFLLFWIEIKPGPLLMISVGALVLAGLVYVFTRPSS